MAGINEKHRTTILRIFLISLNLYSEDTIGKLADLVNSHERVLQILPIVERKLPEQEFLKQIEKLENI